MQEALNNVDKHAGALSAAIRVIFGEAGVEVVISDDGQGFTPQQAEARAQQGHLGLTGLRERVALAGGELDVDSTPGQGTAFTVTLPAFCSRWSARLFCRCPAMLSLFKS